MLIQLRNILFRTNQSMETTVQSQIIEFYKNKYQVWFLTQNTHLTSLLWQAVVAVQVINPTLQSDLQVRSFFSRFTGAVNLVNSVIVKLGGSDMLLVYYVLNTCNIRQTESNEQAFRRHY